MELSKVAKMHEDGLHDSAAALFAEIFAEALHKGHEIPEDTHVVHYTTLDTVLSILGVEPSLETAVWLAKDVSRDDDAFRHPNPGYLRLYDSYSSNDPNEGGFFTDRRASMKRLQRRYPAIWHLFQERSQYPAYLTSFVCLDDLNKADDLVYWRTYGDKGRGCALAIPVSCLRDERNLFRVRYGQDAVQRCVDTLVGLLDEYVTLEGAPPLGTMTKASQLPKSIRDVLSPLVYLHKSDAYRYEVEGRIVLPFSDLRATVRLQSGHREHRRRQWRHYTELESLSAKNILITNTELVLGPAVESPANVQFVLERLLRMGRYYGPKVGRSKISYRQ